MPTPTKNPRRGANNTYPADHDWERVGATLRQIRMDKDVTQDELATAIGFVRASSVSQIERGFKPLTDPKLILAAEFLGVRPIAIRRPGMQTGEAS